MCNEHSVTRLSTQDVKHSGPGHIPKPLCHVPNIVKPVNDRISPATQASYEVAHPKSEENLMLNDDKLRELALTLLLVERAQMEDELGIREKCAPTRTRRSPAKPD